jgi:hypothetical protein
MGALERHGERVCARDGCEQTFTPKTKRAAYCSDSCRALAFRLRSGRNTERAVSERRPTRAKTAALPVVALTWEPP